MIWGNVVCVCLFVCLFVCLCVCVPACLVQLENPSLGFQTFTSTMSLECECGCLFVCLVVCLVASLCGLVLFCC